MLNFKIIFVVAFIQGQTCLASTPGFWQECSGKYYFLSTKEFDIYHSYPFCGQLFKSTRLADFGSSPDLLAKHLVDTCKLKLSNKRRYWIECEYGQRQAECTELTQNRGQINIDIVSCNSLAYPICETTVSPMTSTTPPVTAAKTVPPTRHPPFPSRCARDKGWYVIRLQSYCITQMFYTYTNAQNACGMVNGTLADLHSVKKTLTKIVDGLGLGKTTSLKAWVKGNGSEQVFQISGIANYSFRTEAANSKLRVFCERAVPSPITTPLSKSILPTTDQSSTSTKMTVVSKPSIKSSVSTSQTRSKVTPTTKGAGNKIVNPTSSLPTNTSSLMETRSENTGIMTKQPPSTNATTKSHYWVRFDDQEYCINYEPQNYTFARQYCDAIMNASLVAFLSSIRYFQVMTQLNVDNGSYWVGAHENRNHTLTDECLSYNKQTNTLATSRCARKIFSVCSRSVYKNNATEIKENPAFKKLLEEMTVVRSKTSLNKRKLVSVNDDIRRSTKAVGGLSVLVLCVTVVLMLLVDFSKFVRFCQSLI